MFSFGSSTQQNISGVWTFATLSLVIAPASARACSRNLARTTLSFSSTTTVASAVACAVAGDCASVAQAAPRQTATIPASKLLRNLAFLMTPQHTQQE